MRKIFLVILALALLCAAPALAGTCTIRGTVTDADGAPVQGAQVTLFDANRAEVTTTETDAGGGFAFVNARVDTDVCTVRVFYNDRRQTYTNAAYFTEWYPATGDRAIDKKDTRLAMYHRSGSPAAPSRQTPGLSAIATASAFVLAYIGKIGRKNK
jgi:hypothetical protein